MSKFIILTDNATTEQQDAITTFLQDKGAWWHWFSNSWLFVTDDPDVDVRSIRDSLKQTKSAPLLVLRVDVDSSDLYHWAGAAMPKTNNEKSYTWLNENWKSD
jgi:hypothetical protein